jgi:FG-GAP repeat
MHERRCNNQSFVATVFVALMLLVTPFFPTPVSAFATSSYLPSVVVHRMLASPNAQDYGEFGSWVAVSGGVAVVSAVGESAGGQSAAGRAYTFNDTTGALISTLTSPNAQAGGGFGSSVAITRNIVVVGAPFETADGLSQAGHAYIFNATTGSLIETLTSPNVQENGQFGNLVAASGNTVVVSALYETADGYSDAGRAYTFNARSGALTGTLTSANPQTAGFFGSSVAASPTVVVVGASGETVNGTIDAGHAYTFDAKTGALVSTLASPNYQKDGFFGFSVAASSSIVYVGAPSETADGHGFAGHAYSFNSATGMLITTFASPDPQSDGEFGWSIAATGKTVIVGAPLETANGHKDAGLAYKFNAETGALITKLASPNAQTGGYFGASTGVSGSIIIVGAPYEAAKGYSEAGHAYIH